MPLFWSISFCGRTFIPMNRATSTKASQPKMAVLRCWTLQRPTRAVKLLGDCMELLLVVGFDCMGASLFHPGSRFIGVAP